MRRFIIVLMLVNLCGCSTLYLQPQSRVHTEPGLIDSAATMNDGYVLPLHYWGPREKPKALVLALHGFNDYGTAFKSLGEYLAPAGVLTVSYDQRGFGATSFRGRWPGVSRLIEDLACVVNLLHERYPGTLIHVFGESMGGALAAAAAANGSMDPAADLILSAPAVWGRSTMNPFVRLALWFSANTVPWMHLTGEGLKIMASDNIPMLIALGRDPLVIKRTRVDAINGLSELMDAGLAATPHLQKPTLVLYGEKDQVIPKQPVCKFVTELSAHDPSRVQYISYPNGYHMLTRDLQREVVLQDIKTWIFDRDTRSQRTEHQKPCRA